MTEPKIGLLVHRHPTLLVPRIPRPEDGARRLWSLAVALRRESGQALALGVLFIGLLLIVMLVVPGLAVGYALRAGTASAADAAALACAGRATISQLIDARGQVYREMVTVDPVDGPQAGAAAWGANIRGLPVRTLSFSAVPSGADCTVEATVQATIPILKLLAPGRQTYQWTTDARAKAYATPP